MAISLYPATTSCLQSRRRALQPSLSFGSKVYEGLRVQIPNTWGAQKSNLNAQIFNKVYKSVNSRTSGCKKGIRDVITMMTFGGTPLVLYEYPDGRGSQFMDLWNYFYRDGVIFLGQWIDEIHSNQLLSIMLYLDTIVDFKRLYLINCGTGGDITPVLTVYDTMRSLRTPVTTYNMISALNLSALIVSGGEKGHRYSPRDSFFTIKSPAASAYGQADEVQKEAEELRRVRDYIYGEFANNSGQPLDKILEDFRKGKTLSAQEAVEYGLIDHVLEPARFPPRNDTNEFVASSEKKE